MGVMVPVRVYNKPITLTGAAGGGNVTAGAVGALKQNGGGSGSYPYTDMTVTPGASLLVAMVSLFTSRFSDITSVTWGGAAMTALAEVGEGGLNDRTISLWYKLSPASGNQTLLVNIGDTDAICVGAIEFTNATTIGSQQTNKNASTTSLACPAVTSASGHMVIAVGASLNNAMDNLSMTGTGVIEQTILDNTHGTAGNFRREIATYPGASSVVATVNGSPSADSMWILAADIAP